ncbi:hypothetical protein FH972_023379 [Carpinus fangiana]|uniref:CNH domain-containing protein n=1 Tax=Carpinus fangiana TaxID=176857 RepID=A0A5N6KXA4_9ROSI|nr:hypothetical protein FH972_023379 [Carpinus fangiana]
MLSAFHARPLVELKSRDKSKIESVLAYGDRVLVGLSTGSLRIYRTKEFTDDPEAAPAEEGEKPKIDLLRDEDKFSKKPIQQLAIIKEANVLISLSDAHVSFHDLQTYVLSERLERSKGATSFAVISYVVKDPDTGIPSIVSKLAVAVKRKVMVWSWHDMEPSDLIEESTLPSTVKLITWANGSSLLAGMDPGYVLVDLPTGKITEINRIVDQGEAAGARFGAINSSGMGYMGMGSWVPKPMATKLQEGVMMLAKDVNTLFIDMEGTPVEKRQVPWATAPEAVGYSYPYLLSLATSRGVLEVRNPETLSLLQSIKLADATIMHVPQPNISLAHAGKGFLVASDRCIWRMSAVDYPSQIDELTAAGRFDETLSLVGQLEDTLIEDKEGILRDIKIQKAHQLFDQRKYRDSLDLFSEAGAPPAKVVALYPPLIAGDSSKHFHEKAEDNDQGDDTDRPTSPNQETSVNGAASRSILSAVPLLGSDTASVKLTKAEKDTTSFSKNTAFSMEEKELKYAVNELCAFLAQARVQIQRHMNYDGELKDKTTSQHSRPPYFTLVAQDYHTVTDWRQALFDVATLVDTTLFRAYMFARPQLAGSLFRLDNFCSPTVVEEKLYESGRYNDLIDFLHGKKLHRQALELLDKFGKGEGGVAGGEVDEALRGPRRIVSYLQQLPFELIDLILQFAEWPIRKDPELGMEIFVADTENAETLPRHQVLEFLENNSHSLARQYLEHVIHELGDDTTDFHDRLISLYLERLNKESSNSPAVLASTDEVRGKLEGLLRSSTHYSRQLALRLLPIDSPSFYECRAIILSKLGRHREALQIYVFDMKDYSKAEEYCNATYLEHTISAAAPTTKVSPSTTAVVDPDDPSQAQSVYTDLLSLYLTPPSGHKENLDAALQLLSHHGSRLPALSTLNLLPTSLPVKNLESYFRGRMRAAHSLAREEAIVAALSGVEKTAIEAALLIGDDEASGTSTAKGRSRRIVLEENRLCAVCNKRFGRAAVRVYPDGEVTHYGCADPRRDVGESPRSPRSLPIRGIGVR